MEENNIQGAADKISGLLNPKQDNQVPETNTEPSEPTPEKQEVQESQSESNETPEALLIGLIATSHPSKYAS